MGARTSMGDVGATDRQMDAGSRPKPAQAQRNPEDDLTTAPSARAAEAANALVLVRLSLYFASAQLQPARLRRDGRMHVGRVHAADQVAPSEDPMASTRRTTRSGEARTKVDVTDAPLIMEPS